MAQQKAGVLAAKGADLKSITESTCNSRKNSLE